MSILLGYKEEQYLHQNQDALTKHAATVDHRAAIEAKKCRKDMQQAIANVYRNQELAIISALKTVYFMAKKNLPNDGFSDLKHFIVVQGCAAIGNLSFQSGHGGQQVTYEHSESVWSFQEAIALVVDEDLDNDLLQAEFYSLMIDESTDISVDHNLVIYLGYVLGGEIHCRFFNLVELPGGTAPEIVDAVLNILAMRNMPLDKRCGIATDGASVMVGC